MKDRSHKKGLGGFVQKLYFDLSYVFGFAEWDINAVQPDLIRLVEENKLAGHTILDIGCGSGDNAIYLASRGYQVTGIDYAKKAIEAAAERAMQAEANVDFRVGDAFDLVTLHQQFDIVIDYGLYHNIKPHDIPLYLQNLLHALKPSGQLILQCFGENSPRIKFGPRQVSFREIQKTFVDNWTVTDIRPATYYNKHNSRVPALLAIIHKKGEFQS